MQGPPWTPSPAVRQIGDSLQGRIPNVQGSQLTSSDPERAQLPVQPGTRALASWLKARWSLSSAGTARGASVRKPLVLADGSLRRRDVHEEGRAVDAMTSDVAKGTEIAEALVTHAQTLGIQYVIWRRTEWSSSRIATAWEPYTGSSDHADHVHAEVTPAMAADGEAMTAAIRRVEAALDSGASPAQVSNASSAPVAAVAILGLLGALWLGRRK